MKSHLHQNKRFVVAFDKTELVVKEIEQIHLGRLPIYRICVRVDHCSTSDLTMKFRNEVSPARVLQTPPALCHIEERPDNFLKKVPSPRFPKGTPGRNSEKKLLPVIAALESHKLNWTSVGRILVNKPMPMKHKTGQDDERLCPWCETKYQPAPDHAGTVCPDCRTELLEQPKEFLVDMLGRVAGVNVIVMASLAVHSPDSLDTLGLWNAPEREGFSRRPVTMKEFTRKYRRVH